MFRKFCLAIVLVLVMGVRIVFAQEASKTVAPFVSDYTLGIGHLDTQKVDLDLLEARVTEIIKASTLDVPTQQEALNIALFLKVEAREWLTSFTQAGCRQLYLVTDLNSILSNAPGSVLITADKQTDPNVVVKLLTGGTPPPGPRTGLPPAWPWPKGPPVAENLDGIVFLGTADVLKRVREGKPAQRPEVAAAFAATGDSALHLLLVPTADVRKVVEGLWPNLPAEAGGVSSTVLTHGVVWASVGFDFTPKLSFKIVVQSQDADSAKALGKLIQFLYDDLKQDMRGFKRDFPEGEKLLDVMTPQVNGSQLVLSLNDEQLSTMASVQIVPALQKARLNAARVRSMNNIRQIIIGCIVYENDHKGQWPDDFNAIQKNFPNTPQVFVNASKPADKASYVYVKPTPAGLKSRGTTIVVHEQLTDDDKGIAAGFADGHVEWLTVEEFQRQLKAAKQ
jgi:hypothetical protein